MLFSGLSLLIGVEQQCARVTRGSHRLSNIHKTFNVKMEINCDAIQTKHVYTHYIIASCLAKVLSIERENVEVFYIYEIHNGLVVYVEIKQYNDNMDIDNGRRKGSIVNRINNLIKGKSDDTIFDALKTQLIKKLQLQRYSKTTLDLCDMNIKCQLEKTNEQILDPTTGKTKWKQTEFLKKTPQMMSTNSNNHNYNKNNTTNGAMHMIQKISVGQDGEGAVNYNVAGFYSGIGPTSPSATNPSIGNININHFSNDANQNSGQFPPIIGINHAPQSSSNQLNFNTAQLNHVPSHSLLQLSPRSSNNNNNNNNINVGFNQAVMRMSSVDNSINSSDRGDAPDSPDLLPDLPDDMQNNNNHNNSNNKPQGSGLSDNLSLDGYGSGSGADAGSGDGGGISYIIGAGNTSGNDNGGARTPRMFDGTSNLSVEHASPRNSGKIASNVAVTVTDMENGDTDGDDSDSSSSTFKE